MRNKRLIALLAALAGCTECGGVVTKRWYGQLSEARVPHRWCNVMCEARSGTIKYIQTVKCLPAIPQAQGHRHLRRSRYQNGTVSQLLVLCRESTKPSILTAVPLLLARIMVPAPCNDEDGTKRRAPRADQVLNAGLP